MATPLTGLQVNNTYNSLIKVGDNGPLSGIFQVLSDGDGNEFNVQASTAGIKFTGTLDADTATSVLGFDAPKNIVIAGGGGTWTADQVEDTVTFAGGDNVTIGLAGDIITWNVATSSLAGYATEAYVLSQTASLSASLAVDIATNVADIATNAGDISTNSGLISANATDISNMLSGIGNVISVNSVDGAITIDAGTGINVNTNTITGQVTISNTAIPVTSSLLVTASSDFSILTFEKGDASTFEVDVTPREVIESVINKEAVALSKGTPVYVSGSTGNASHVYLADASDASKIPASYVLKQDLDPDEEGFGLALGFINGVDTSGFNAADTIYLAVGGGYTNVAPTGSANFIQRLGNVIKVDATNGSGVFTGAGAVRGLPNLAEGYAWVGDADGVPQPVATSSFGGGVTINNNVNDYLLTATGVTNTINGESKLKFDAVNQTLTIESSNSTNGLTFDGGVFGAANPKISATGFTNIHMDKNLVLENQTKIAFDTDATNTYIAADLTTPENLTINADGYVDVYIADGFRVWENNASPAAMFKVEKSGDFPRVGIGANVTTTDSELYVDGIVEAEEFLYDYNNAQLAYQGETIRLGTTSTTAGQLYAWNGTNWILADADVENTARALLGIAIANTSDKGMLVNGWYKTSTTYSNGQLYMSATAGGFTTTPPSSTGQFVRIVGHGINSTTIRFNPSNEYYTVE